MYKYIYIYIYIYYIVESKNVEICPVGKTWCFIVLCLLSLGFALDICCVAVMLQPFEYDGQEKVKHKFLILSMPAPDVPVESVDQLVCIGQMKKQLIVIV